MTLEQRVTALTQLIAADIKAINNNVGTLSGLSTTAKNNIVAAINEIFTMAQEAGAINDAAGSGVTDETWSASKISSSLSDAIAGLRTELTAGAAAALDTFSELAAAINNDPTFASTLATQMSKRVRFDSTQTLTVGEQLQACTNIGIGNPDVDLVAIYNTAKA